MSKVACGADNCESVHCQVVGYIDHETGEVLCGTCLYERNLSPTAYGIESMTRNYVVNTNLVVDRPLFCNRCERTIIEED